MGRARFADFEASGVAEVRHDLACLDEPGLWAVVVAFEGSATCVRFERSTHSAHPQVASSARSAGGSGPPEPAKRLWQPLTGEWSSSLDRAAYLEGVGVVRERIADGTVYQVNLCRVLDQELGDEADLSDLDRLLLDGNPAPFAARIEVPEAGLDLVCASPEAFLLRSGSRLESRPIKGTAATTQEMLVKDFAENVMITDLVRNDLSHVCREGSVSVDALCATEGHPGLVHLVSRVSGELRPGVSWPEIFAATFPPGSVTGAPKSTALGTIRDLEKTPRGPYCGAVGWVDSRPAAGPAHGRRTPGASSTPGPATVQAELAVGIRTFWADRGDTGRRLHFGTGAGITWGSDPEQEWAETELKAARLVGLASGMVTT